jgi:deoxyhypusine synthase
MAPVTDFSYEEFDLSDVKTYPLNARRSKAHVEQFAREVAPAGGVGAFVASLPDILAAADLKAVVRALVDARRTRSGIVWGLGAHVIKTGVGPVLIQLMERGFVSAIAMNGAAVIHDFEVALIGRPRRRGRGARTRRFGMADKQAVC